jgi:hypothetical protein
MSVPTIFAVRNGPLVGHPVLESIRDTLSAGPERTELTVFLVGLAAFLLLILLAARFWGRERRPAPERRVDYLTLAVDLLGLSEADRRDLQRIARRAGLAHPAAMLLSPANLARAAAALRAENDEELRARIEHLSLRLFDAPLPDIPRTSRWGRDRPTESDAPRHRPKSGSVRNPTS